MRRSRFSSGGSGEGAICADARLLVVFGIETLLYAQLQRAVVAPREVRSATVRPRLLQLNVNALQFQLEARPIRCETREAPRLCVAFVEQLGSRKTAATALFAGGLAAKRVPQLRDLRVAL